MLKILTRPLFEAADVNAGGGAPAAVPDAAASAGSLLYGDAPAAKPADASADKPADKPVDGGKPAEKPADQPGDKPAEKTPEQIAAEVPEDGKYEFKLAEGFDLDVSAAEMAMPILKELGFTRAEADKAATAFAQYQAKAVEAQSQAWQKTQTDWQAEARADQEYGGAKFDASLAAANSAIEKFGTPKLKEYLQYSGAGNHPEIIRLMVKIGNAISDDKPVSTDSTGGASKDVHPSQILYN